MLKKNSEIYIDNRIVNRIANLWYCFAKKKGLERSNIFENRWERERETLVAEWNKYRITCASNTLLNPFQVKKKKK